MRQVNNQPGPGRSTSEGALNQIKKEVAASNARVQKEAREVRAVGERKAAARRRALDLA